MMPITQVDSTNVNTEKHPHNDTQTQADRSPTDGTLSAHQQRCLLCFGASLPLPSPYSPTFLHGNIAYYEHHNSNFIVHDGVPATLIIFFNETIISDMPELSEKTVTKLS